MKTLFYVWHQHYINVCCDQHRRRFFQPRGYLAEPHPAPTPQRSCPRLPACHLLHPRGQTRRFPAAEQLASRGPLTPLDTHRRAGRLPPLTWVMFESQGPLLLNSWMLMIQMRNRTIGNNVGNCFLCSQLPTYLCLRCTTSRSRDGIYNNNIEFRDWRKILSSKLYLIFLNLGVCNPFRIVFKIISIN